MLDYAIKMAKNLPYKRGEQRHYCVITDKRGKIVAEASNSYTKSSPKMLKAGNKVGLKDKIYWHAECRAIYSLRNINKAYKIVVVRVNSFGESVNSKPCPLCERLIKDIGIKIVEYSV